MASFLNASRRSLKESANQLLTVRFYSRLSWVKSSAQNSRMLGGRKVFAFYFYKPFSFKFWILRELKVLTLYFEFFPLKFTANMKPKQFQISCIS